MFPQRSSPESWDAYRTCTPYNIGVNSILLPVIPYTIVTALHDKNVEVALILGTAFSGAFVIIGIFLWFAGAYRSWPYGFEIFMLLVNAVLLAVSYAEPHDVIKYHNFITNSFYATFSLLSIVAKWPFTLQYVREFVPTSAENHAKVIRSANVTSAVWAAAFVTNTLLYLVPICRGRDWHHSSALNLLFRIILPILTVAAAAVFCRLWPNRVCDHLLSSIVFNAGPEFQKQAVNPLAMAATGGGAVGYAGGYGPQLPPPAFRTADLRPPASTIHVQAVAS